MPGVLLDYLAAVDARTTGMLEGLSVTDLDRVVDTWLGPAGDYGGAAGQHRRRLPPARRAGGLRAGLAAALLSGRAGVCRQALFQTTCSAVVEGLVAERDIDGRPHR